MTFGRNFLPGPTGVHPEVLEAMTAPMYAHFLPGVRPLLEAIQPPLQELLGTTRPVFAVTCSGTGLLEAAVRNTVRHRVLVVVGGFFGEYFATIAESCGREVIRAHVPPGQTLEPEQLEAFLDGPGIDTVAMVHSETSTGALAPIEALAKVVHAKEDVMLVVDAVSSAAGVPIEMDRIGIDFTVTGSQKALAVPPGLAIGAVSERLEARAHTVPAAGHYFSVTRWVANARDRRLFETPALSLYFALRRQLERIAATGGWPARYARHAALAARMAEWVATHPEVELVARAGRRSPTISALRLPERSPNPMEIVTALDQQGFLIAPSLDPRMGKVIRIGHMGDTELAHLDALLDAVEALL